MVNLTIDYINKCGFILPKFFNQKDIDSLEIQELISKIIVGIKTIDVVRDFKIITDINKLCIPGKSKYYRAILFSGLLYILLSNFGLEKLYIYEVFRNVIIKKLKELCEDKEFGDYFLELREKLNKHYSIFGIKF